MSKHLPRRLVIYARDVENLTGLSPRSARRMIHQVRKELGKRKGQYLTIPEFCAVTGFNQEHVREFLSG